MESFEDLGLSPELVEALASEGIEHPTELQEAAIPVLGRGNNLLLASAPGSGTLVAWGAPVLGRVSQEGTGPQVLALTPTRESAQRLAESLQRLASAVGHTVAALGSPWALPGHARVLFGTSEDVLGATRAGDVDLSTVQILVVDQLDRIERLGDLTQVEDVMGFLPKEGQRIVVALPVTDGVRDFAERHARRAAIVPPRSTEGGDGASSPDRGTIRFRVTPDSREEGLLTTVAELLEDDTRHVLLFFSTEDRAADMGDYLSLHGFACGSPGDTAVPVWLGVQELEARAAAEGTDGLVVVSCDVPADPDSLDRRHGLTGGGVVLAFPREMTHLRDVARRTGYSMAGFPLPRPKIDKGEALRTQLAEAVENEDVATYLLLLEPLFERYDPAEIAAAAAALLRKKASPTAAAQSQPTPGSPGRSGPTAWVKLFLSVGERDGLTPGDMVGAITGETGLPSEKVGKIDIRESHCVVEVQEPVARQVISALNGTTIRGRAVRADFDRARPRPSGSPPRGRPPRRG
jgi:ATP-dependent RNA helicase DeaD